ncbi:hypothetical protein GCM10027090_02840 [Sinomonas soli]
MACSASTSGVPERVSARTALNSRASSPRETRAVRSSAPAAVSPRADGQGHHVGDRGELREDALLSSADGQAEHVIARHESGSRGHKDHQDREECIESPGERRRDRTERCEREGGSRPEELLGPEVHRILP